MQGTGTKADPYIPETWDDFVAAVGTVDAYVSLPVEGGTYDMNEIAPEGNFTLNINCTEIQGNEWSISKAYNVKVYANSCNVYNLHFPDFLWEKSSENEMIIDGYFYYCQFTGIISGYRQSIFMSNREKRYCSVNVKFIGESWKVNYSGGKMYFCNIRIDQSDAQPVSGISIAINAENSYIDHVSSATNNAVSLSGKLNVLHSDLGNYVSDSSGNKHAVTEEQLRDAAYLSSLGFPIVQ